MNAHRSFEDGLAARARSVGLGDAASVLLEALAPLAWLGAQLTYLAEPLWGLHRPSGANDLRAVLEDPARLADLVERLREGPPDDV